MSDKNSGWEKYGRVLKGILDFYPVSLAEGFVKYLQIAYPPDFKVVDTDFLELVKEFKDYYEANFLGSGELGEIVVKEEDIPDSENKRIKVREIRYGKKGH